MRQSAIKPFSLDGRDLPFWAEGLSLRREDIHGDDCRERGVHYRADGTVK